MRAKPLVLESVNAPDGVHCVDLFERPDGSFGFELCRRVAEDGQGWGICVQDGAVRFETKTAARGAAVELYSWIDG